jgi:hypothetical protein
MANLLTYTEQFDNAAWVKSPNATDMSVLANSAAAPAFAGVSATMADTLTDLSAVAQCSIYSTKAKASNDTSNWVGSVYVKKLASSPSVFPSIHLQFRTIGTTVTYGLRVNAYTGAVANDPSATAPNASGVEDVDASWWRFWLRGADNATGNTEVRFTIYPGVAGPTITSGAASSYTGSIVAWGANVELTDTLTTYQPHPSYAFTAGTVISSDPGTPVLVGQGASLGFGIRLPDEL